MKIFMLVAALVMGVVSSTTTYAAPAGKPFLRGVISPTDLANRIEQSLSENPKGTKIIDPELCMKNGSCATPLNYLEMFQESDPGAHLTKVSQVPDFLRSLRVVDGPPGEYWVACLKKSEGKKGTYTPVLHCLSRRFKPDEKAWIDTNTKRIILASDCTNPVEKEIPPKACVEIHVPTRPGDSAIRFAILGPAAVRDDCIAVKRAGETDFENWWPDECADVRCNFSEDAQFMHQPVQRIGSYVPVSGEHIFRVPANFAAKDSPYAVALCLDRGEFGNPGDAPKEPKAPTMPVAGEDPAIYALKFEAYTEYLEAHQSWRDDYNAWRGRYIAWRDAWIAGHSDTINVVWYGYRGNVATVYYTKDDVPPGMPVMYFPWGEYKAQ